jgi:ubiquinone/menaquinone biosynthesis C-methylase UbiE
MWGLGGIRPLSHEEARAFYDRLGPRQDLHRFYEDRAVEELIHHADFAQAHALVEFGCGTGRLAARLLNLALPATATYVGLDVSRTMAALARARMTAFGRRARVIQTEGSPKLPLDDRSCDRLLATYVIDLLSPADAHTLIGEAHRVLQTGGRLCLASLTTGKTAFSRAVQGIWQCAYRLRPQLVGGCRPVHLMPLLTPGWRLVHRSVICRIGLCTEVLVAERIRREPVPHEVQYVE